MTAARQVRNFAPFFDLHRSFATFRVYTALASETDHHPILSMIVADRVDLPGCATATTMIAGLMDVAVRTWTAIVATVPRASPPSSVEMVPIANTAGMVAENAASVAVRIAMAIVTAAAVDADVNWQDQQSDDPKISTKARFVMNRALCFVRLKIESGLRIDLAGGLDRDAFEAAGLGVGITGGKGFGRRLVGEVQDQYAAGHAFARRASNATTFADSDNRSASIRSRSSAACW